MLWYVLIATFAASTVRGDNQCVAGIKLDPLDRLREGGDYTNFEQKTSDIRECEEACCNDSRCAAFSYNNPMPSDLMNCHRGSICCNLKEGPPPQTNSSGKGIVSGSKPINPKDLAKPSLRILEYMDMELTMFMHFNLATFANIEHNCYQGACLNESLFNPSNLNATQWVMTAKEMGAGEICLTAHHEGGFCLWPTNYSYYSVAASPWKGGKGDVIKEFTDACSEHGIRPCFYLSASADAYHRNMSVEYYIYNELGMFTEILTQYGPIYRFWFDHYGSPCGGSLTGCPGGFPAYWYNVTQHIRDISPETLMGPGPDIWYNGGGESGSGMYPLWNPSDTRDGTPWNSTTVSGPQGMFFRPRESDMTIQNPGDKWFWGKGHAYYNASQLWEHWMVTVGRGANLILNIPPDTTGIIPEYFTAETKKFGDALRATFSTPLASVYDTTCNCNETITLQFLQPIMFDLVVTTENMINGQRIVRYEVDANVNKQWMTLTIPNGQTVGHKVVDQIAKPITATEVRFRCEQSVVDPIYIRQFAVYKAALPW